MSPDTHTILSLDTGNCSVRFEDLDHDGKLEVVTCDDHFAYRYCSFAESPMPEVVFVFDRGQGKYIPATPRFPAYFQAAIEAATKESQSAPESKCAALAPVLQLMYLDRGTEATALFRRLYKGPDVGVLLSALSAEVKQSPMWVPR